MSALREGMFSARVEPAARSSNLTDLLNRFAFATFCLAVAIYVGVGVEDPAYKYLFTLPVTFGLVYALLLGKWLRKFDNPFLTVFSVVALARYAVLPLLIVLGAAYRGRSVEQPSVDAFNLAFALMTFELVTAALAINFFQNRKQTKVSATPLPEIDLRGSSGGQIAYVFFGGAILVLLALHPAARESITFLVPTNSEFESFRDLTALEALAAYGVLVLKQLAFVGVVAWAGKNWRVSGSAIYPLLATLAGGAAMSVYVGTNRTDIVITGIAVAVVLLRVFGRAVKPLLGLVALGAVAIVTVVTDARQLAEARHVNGTIGALADTVSVYVGGPYNVAIAVEAKEWFPQAGTLPVLFMDLFRPMIGPNLLLQNLGIPYSNIYFNLRMFPGTDKRSQILPMIGQGNIHFGALLAPLLTIVFIALAYWLLRMWRNTCDLVLFAFLTPALARLGFIMGQNTMNMINDLSLNLVLFLVPYFAARVLTATQRTRPTAGRPNKKGAGCNAS